MAKSNKSKPGGPVSIRNRRAAHDYSLSDTYVTGLVLTGAETKSLRLGHGQLRGAYVTVKDNELWLLNAQINGTRGVVVPEQMQTRTRKLLAKRREIDRLIAAKEQGNTIVPLEILTGGRYVKLRIAVGKGKRQYDKRQTLKAREQGRAMKAAIKRSVR